MVIACSSWRLKLSINRKKEKLNLSEWIELNPSEFQSQVCDSQPTQFSCLVACGGAGRQEGRLHREIRRLFGVHWERRRSELVIGIVHLVSFRRPIEKFSWLKMKIHWPPELQLAKFDDHLVLQWIPFKSLKFTFKKRNAFLVGDDDRLQTLNGFHQGVQVSF